MPTLFLDFDDTLFNTAAFKAALEAKGLVPSKDEIVRDQTLIKLVSDLEVAEPGFMAQFVYPGARELLETYKDDCYIVTSTHATTGSNIEDPKDVEAFQWLKLQLCGLATVFGEDEEAQHEHIAVVAEEKVPAYRTLIEKYGLDPEGVVCVDDKDSYLRAARDELHTQVIKMEHTPSTDLLGLEQVPNPEFNPVNTIESLRLAIEALWKRPLEEAA